MHAFVRVVKLLLICVWIRACACDSCDTSVNLSLAIERSSRSTPLNDRKVPRSCDRKTKPFQTFL